MIYKGRFRAEFRRLLRFVEGHVGNIECSKNLQSTQTLCRCFLVSIVHMLRGADAALGVRSVNSHHTICRSVFEHITDLMFIALRKDSGINKQFAHYYRFILYKRMGDHLDILRGENPRIKAEYQQYLLDVIVSKEQEESLESTDVQDFKYKSVQNTIDRQLTKSWTGMDFQQRIKTVLAEAALGATLKNPMSTYNLAENKAKETIGKKEPDRWESMNFTERATATIGTICQDAGKALSQDYELMGPFLEMATFGFITNSQYTHPTPYSVVPHLDPRRDSFELEYRFHDSVLDGAEKEQFLLLCSAVNGFSICLPLRKAVVFREGFHCQIKTSPQISAWYLSEIDD